jgi:hypothetical protein
MTDASFEQELLGHAHQLSAEKQQRLLNYARVLAKTRHIQGESGQSIIQSPGLFRVEDLDEMAQAIAEDCERIDWGGWE